MAVNKVVYNTKNGAEVLIDLTGDSVTPETLAEGVTAHDAKGEIITGIMCDYSNVPSYHFVECARVLENIENFKTSHPNSLVFGAVSDIHVYNGNATYESKSKASIKHSAFALEMVGAMAQCDFIANLGDNCWENGIDTDNALLGAKYSINALKPAFDRLVSFNLVGNHDKSDYTQMQYDLIGVHNDFDVASSTVIRGFGYKDYTNKKVRVIVLNTCDYLNASGGCALSYEQKDFLMRALDLSAKSNASSWQILLLSHIPLDWNGGDYNYYTDLQAILNAYEDGTTASITVNTSYAKNETPSNYATYSSGKLVYNYSGKNVAKIIANIHGHVHTNKVSKIANTNIARVATANTNPDLNKSESYPDYGDYSITTTEANKIKKVSGTAKDTSATFYCIDLDNQTIYAYGYGADIDRTIPYKDTKYYTVTLNLTNVTSSNTSTSVAEYDDFITMLTKPSTNYQWGAVKVTMGGVDITVDVWKESTGQINISDVNGNIVITAVASEPLITETITPHIAPRSTWYNGLGSGKITLNSSNMEGALGVSTANSYKYTDRNSKTFYLMPIGSQYCKATLNYSATDGKAVRYYLQAVKDNGGTFTSVATVGKGTNNVITWTKGAADYLLISIEHTDGTTKWDWNSAGKTITVTFSNQ
jgi:YD repeat-containing protein